MPNYLYYSTGLNAGSGGVNAQVQRLAPKIRLDLSKINGGLGVVANDTIDFFVTERRVRVNRLIVEIVRAAGGTCTARFGDTTDDDRFLGQAATGDTNTAVDLNAAVGTVRTSILQVNAADADFAQPNVGSGGVDYWTAGGTLRATILNTNAVAICDVTVDLDRYPQL